MEHRATFGMLALRQDQGSHVARIALRGRILRSDRLCAMWSTHAESVGQLPGDLVQHGRQPMPQHLGMTTYVRRCEKTCLRTEVEVGSFGISALTPRAAFRCFL